eukprot:3921225-Rhodomonas_salina.1
MSFSALTKGLLVAGGVAVVGHFVSKALFNRKRSAADDAQKQVESQVDRGVVIEQLERIQVTPSNILITGAHLVGGGLLLGMAWGSMQSAQHVDSIAGQRRLLLVSMPVTGGLAIWSNITNERDSGLDMKKSGKMVRLLSVHERRVESTKLDLTANIFGTCFEQDKLGKFGQVAHTALYVAVVVFEALYNRTDPETNKVLIALSAAAMTANFLVGKLVVRGHVLTYASGVKKLKR